MKENTYTIEYLKKLFEIIIQEEESTNNIKIKGNIFTLGEYYKSSLLKENLKITKPINSLNHLTAPIRFGGWFNKSDKTTIVIINKMYEYMEAISTSSLTNLIHKIYHELRHRYQDKFMKNANKYTEFFIILEKIIIINDPAYYRLNHDSFLIEIDADKNAINKTENLLKKKNIIDEDSKKYINEVNKSINERSILYNSINMFEKFHFILEGKVKKHKKNSENPLNDSIIELNSNTDSQEYNSIKRVLSYIYNQDGTFKSIKEIIERKNELDINIINTVLCSKPFIKSIKLNTLKKSEIKYMLELLEILYQEMTKKINLLKKINTNEGTLLYLYTEKKMTKKLKETITLRSVLMNTLLNDKKNNNNITLYDYIKKRKSK